MMYAVKELCRGMAKPTELHWNKLKRLGRYLVENRRTVMRYNWQGHEPEITGYSDSDWAGCRVTGKSTSGGALMIGSHFIKGWARTQNHVTLSSAEAELVALVKCSAELLGAKSMTRDFGIEKGGFFTRTHPQSWPLPSARVPGNSSTLISALSGSRSDRIPNS